MELKKLQCESCGATLDIKPGLSQVVCDYCGLIYGIENNESSSWNNESYPVKLNIHKTDSSTTQRLVSLYGDSSFYDFPFDSAKIINEHIISHRDKDFSSCFIASIPQSQSKAGYDLEVPLEVAYQDIEIKTRFWASLSYITGETYRLVDRIELDLTPLYDEKPVIKFSDNYVTEEEVKQLKKAHQIFMNVRMIEGVLLGADTEDYLSPKGNNYLFYDDRVETTVSKRRRDSVMSFVNKYGFETKEFSEYSFPYWERFEIAGALLIKRLWVWGRHALTIAKDMTPNLALTILTEQEMHNLDALKNNKVINSIALQMSDVLNKGYERAIAEQDYINPVLLMNSDSISLSKDTIDGIEIVDQGTAFQHTGKAPCLWVFNNLGMKNIDNSDLRRAFIAALYANIMKYVTVNNELRFEPTQFTNSFNQQLKRRNTKDYMLLKLVNAYHSEAVYDDWI